MWTWCRPERAGRATPMCWRSAAEGSMAGEPPTIKGAAVVALYCLKALKDERVKCVRKARAIFGAGGGNRLRRPETVFSAGGFAGACLYAGRRIRRMQPGKGNFTRGAFRPGGRLTAGKPPWGNGPQRGSGFRQGGGAVYGGGVRSAGGPVEKKWTGNFLSSGRAAF